MSATRNTLLIVFILTTGLIASGTVVAQPYPSKPVRLIVPTAPGATADIVARVMAQKLSDAFRQSVVVDNRPGAGNSLGTEIAVRANPDGYTLIVVSGSYAANAALYKLPYDAKSDVTPIALIGEAGLVVALHPSLSVTSVKELMAYDKANPGKLNYGSAGIGSGNHLGTELFNQMADTRMKHVPYKGTGPAMNDLLGGQIQVVIGGMPPMIPQVKANRLRGIAVTTAQRSNAVPDIPTVAETIAGYEYVNWAAVLGPKSLPNEVVARWNSEINRILQLPDLKARMAADGMEPAGGSPARFRELLTRDIAKWQKVVKLANIKLEH